MNVWYIILPVIGFVVGAVLFFLIGVAYRKRTAEKQIGSAEEEATRIINKAIKTGENKQREMLLEAKDEIHKSRTELEKEMKESRADLQKQERRLQQKEESLDKKTDAYEKRKEELTKKHAQADALREEIEQVKKAQLEVLERISGISQEEAKEYLLKQVEDDVRHERAVRIKEIKEQYKEEADQYAREIISIAIQRCAADHAAEATVSVVPLPNDEMKGRIIIIYKK